MTHTPLPFPMDGSTFVVESIDRTAYRWAKYKPDGARQMGKPGRWQKQVWHGDWFKWENCEEPSGEIAPLTEDGPISAAFKGHTSLLSEYERVKAERDEARKIVRDIYWMALRYADGRKSYAVGMVNDAVRKGYDAGWLVHSHEKDPAFARDGMGPEYRSVEARSEALEAENKRLREALETIEKAPAWGYPEKWETTPAEVRQLARKALGASK